MTPTPLSTPDLNALSSTAAQAVATYTGDQNNVIVDQTKLTTDQQLAATDGASATAAVLALIAGATQILAGLPAPITTSTVIAS
jgi:hypothetical protein